MDYFINEAYEISYNNYLQSIDKKEGIIYNSYLVVLIRKLIVIYGDLDLLIPFEKRDVNLFDTNVTKYGYPSENLLDFKNTIQSFLEAERNNIVPNPYYLKLEKMLIDMYMLKKINYDVNSYEEKMFKDILYSPNAINELIISYNYLHAKNENDSLDYFVEQDKLNQKKMYDENKHLLSPEAYRVVDKNYTDIKALNAEDVEKINESVYNKLEVNKNAVNFDYAFDKALYHFFHKDDRISSGNGYVDILLILGIVCTLVMIILIITLFFI